MNLFLLAAGEGTRFRPHTQILPKPALPFCGLPLLYQSYFLAQCLKPKQVVINTFHLPKEMHRVGSTLEREGASVLFSDEHPTLLGSAGGMAKAKDLLKGPDGFIALNADEVIAPRDPEILQAFYEQARGNGHLATLMVMRHPEAGKKFGAIWVNPQGKVLGFGKQRPETTEDLIPYHFIGPMYFREEIFLRLQEVPTNILHDVLKQALADGESVGIFPVECDWYETGNLEDYNHATAQVLKSMALGGNPFWEKWRRELVPAMELVKSADTIIFKHSTASIAATADIKGYVVLGAHCEVGEGASLENVVCYEGVRVSPRVSLKNELVLKSISG